MDIGPTYSCCCLIICMAQEAESDCNVALFTVKPGRERCLNTVCWFVQQCHFLSGHFLMTINKTNVQCRYYFIYYTCFNTKGMNTFSCIDTQQTLQTLCSSANFIWMYMCSVHLLLPTCFHLQAALGSTSRWERVDVFVLVVIFLSWSEWWLLLLHPLLHTEVWEEECDFSPRWLKRICEEENKCDDLVNHLCGSHQVFKHIYMSVFYSWSDINMCIDEEWSSKESITKQLVQTKGIWCVFKYKNTCAE